MSKKVYMPEVFRLSSRITEKGFQEAIDYEAEPLPALRQLCRGIGHINATTDIDGKRRRLAPFIDYKGRLVPQLSFLTLCDYLGIDMRDIKIRKGHQIQLSPDIKIPIDSKGQMIINFCGRWGQAFRHYSFVDILKSYVALQKGKPTLVDLNELRGKICLVGLTAVATHDLNPIPLQESYPMVGIHANLMSTILTRNFIVRACPIANILILIILSLIIIVSTLRLRPLFGILAALAIFFGFITAAFILFGFFNCWIDLFYPSLVIILVYVCCTFYKYIKEQQRRLLMQKELDIAQRIQKSFLKEQPPQKDGLDMAVTMVPARAIGGDLYDFIETKDAGFGIMIGDVSGKGIPAALFMAMTVSDFRFHAKTQADGLEVVTKLNDQIASESTAGLFVTLCYAVIDGGRKNLSIVDCGHLPIIYIDKNKKTNLITAKGGMALGIMEGVEFAKQNIPIKGGDLFVLYTDGVTEARNLKKEEFGEERLKESVLRYKDLNATDIVKRLYEDILKFRGRATQHDDITIIAVKVL
jgi:hypothetical protein